MRCLLRKVYNHETTGTSVFTHEKNGESRLISGNYLSCCSPSCRRLPISDRSKNPVSDSGDRPGVQAAVDRTGGGSRDRSPITISRRVVTFVPRGVASVRTSRVAADRSAVADSVFIRRDNCSRSPPAPSGQPAVAAFSRLPCFGLRARRRRCHRRRPVSAICTARAARTAVEMWVKPQEVLLANAFW